MAQPIYPRQAGVSYTWLILSFCAIAAAAWGFKAGTVMENEVLDTQRQQAEAEALVMLDLPDFAAEPTVQAKKDAFFGFLEPLAEAENARVARLRDEVEQWRARLDSGRALSAETLERLEVITARYYVSDDLAISDQIDELLIKVDTIPMSLILAQAANESAWGTSRFALVGNNLFGQWCFSVGCGVVPDSRPEGEIYEVRAFEHAGLSVRAYILNLNRHRSYADLRALRAERRAQGLAVTGLDLTPGLLAYSTRREEYVDELNAMIEFNDLLDLD